MRAIFCEPQLSLLLRGIFYQNQFLLLGAGSVKCFGDISHMKVEVIAIHKLHKNIEHGFTKIKSFIYR